MKNKPKKDIQSTHKVFLGNIFQSVPSLICQEVVPSSVQNLYIAEELGTFQVSCLLFCINFVNTLLVAFLFQAKLNYRQLELVNTSR